MTRNRHVSLLISEVLWSYFYILGIAFAVKLSNLLGSACRAVRVACFRCASGNLPSLW